MYVMKNLTPYLNRCLEIKVKDLAHATGRSKVNIMQPVIHNNK